MMEWERQWERIKDGTDPPPAWVAVMAGAMLATLTRVDEQGRPFRAVVRRITHED